MEKTDISNKPEFKKNKVAHGMACSSLCGLRISILMFIISNIWELLVYCVVVFICCLFGRAVCVSLGRFKAVLLLCSVL